MGVLDIPFRKCSLSGKKEHYFPEIQSSTFRCRKHLCFWLTILHLEIGLLSRAEPFCGALAPLIKVRLPNILHRPKANACLNNFGCSDFPESVHSRNGISTFKFTNPQDIPCLHFHAQKEQEKNIQHSQNGRYQ